ncbi:MAG TPA: hypothetical protein PKI19_05795 [Elusimicrobiales bacterium]|nr:hypothetical protein [Elusimicrobiales bacterium]
MSAIDSRHKQSVPAEPKNKEWSKLQFPVEFTGRLAPGGTQPGDTSLQQKMALFQLKGGALNPAAGKFLF